MFSTEAMLPLLKLSLNISGTARDALLVNILKSSANRLMKDGIRLDPACVEDQQLVVMHAAWRYNATKDKTMQMPPALRLAINDRKVDTVTEDSTDGQ